MKIKKMGWFLSLFPIVGITLSPFGIYIREDHLDHEWIRTHETIHWKQQMEMLIIFFYLWYLIEWGLRAITHGNKAYYLISFEVESHLHDGDHEYLKTRKHFAWIKYMNQ
jgi:hypothetical protein